LSKIFLFSYLPPGLPRSLYVHIDIILTWELENYKKDDFSELVVMFWGVNILCSYEAVCFKNEICMDH